MTEEKTVKATLSEAVIRICPVCGVVNPAGPSDSCPHLQLVRFEGVDPSLENLLTQVAEIRNEYRAMVSELRRHVMNAARDGRATVEATQKARASEVAAQVASSEPFALTNPEVGTPKPKPKPKKKKKKAPSTPQVDPRQLALLVREPPQGDA